MSLQPTRGTDFQQLTATVAVQSMTIAESYRNIIIRTLSTDGIRISINGKPDDLSGTKGILVKKDHPLIINNHIIHAIKYIREIGAAVDVGFDILGLYYERNT